MRVGELVADEDAVLVVFVGRHHVGVARRPGQRAGRDAALRPLVALVAFAGGHGRPVQPDHLAAVARRIEIQLRRVEAGEALRFQQVGQHDAGALEAVGEVEDLRDGVEAVGDAGRRRDDARVVPLSRAEHLPQIPLLRLGGHARGRSGPLHVDADHGDLHHRGGAERFGHQRESAARGGAHRAAAGMRRADRHVDDADLVLDLPHHDPELARVPCHPHQHARRGAHRIGAVELDAGGDAAHRQALVARGDRQRLAGNG